MNGKTLISWLTGLVLFAVSSVGWAEAPPADPKARLAKAEAMFAERCKKAGEFIHRTVDNVEGVVLLKLRPKGINYGDQFLMDDPYGGDSTEDRYIRSFLIGRRKSGSLTSKPEEAATPGYRYVEAIDPADGKRYRYTGSVKEVTKTSSRLIGGDGRTFKTKEFTLDKVPAPGTPPRYGVTYDDLSTREEREHWIAGSSLKVIDLNTNEVIAERIGYMMDPGQGEKGGGRQPWSWAAEMACPGFYPDSRRGAVPAGFYQAGQTRNFVERVLRIKQGN